MTDARRMVRQWIDLLEWMALEEGRPWYSSDDISVVIDVIRRKPTILLYSYECPDMMMSFSTTLQRGRCILFCTGSVVASQSREARHTMRTSYLYLTGDVIASSLLTFKEIRKYGRYCHQYQRMLQKVKHSSVVKNGVIYPEVVGSIPSVDKVKTLRPFPSSV